MFLQLRLGILAPGVLSCVLGFSLCGQETVIPLTGDEEVFARDFGPTGIDPEELLNCDIVDLQRQGFDLIVPNHDSPDLALAGRLRAFAKGLTRVLIAHAGGTDPWPSLAAIEFDWVTPDSEPPFQARLPEVKSFVVMDSSGFPALFARAYGLDAAQYALRRGALESMNGPLREFPVWMEDTIVGDTVTLAGSGNSYFGRAAASVSLDVLSTGDYEHGVAYAGQLLVTPAAHVPYLFVVLTVSASDPLLDEPTARSIAIASGTYFPGNADLDRSSLPAGGVIFAEGSLSVDAKDLSGAFTFAAVGHVTLLGKSWDIEAAQDLVLAVSYGGDVEVMGKSHALFGEVHAPTGTVTFDSRKSSFHGVLMGDHVSVQCRESRLSDGTHASPEN